MALLPLACSPHSGDHAAPAPRKSLSERLDEKNGYTKDAQGNWKPTNDRRSSFESQGESPYFKGSYDKKNYQTNSYAKKSWWGNKEYGRKQYADTPDASRFQETSRFDGMSAQEAGTSTGLTKTNYQTGAYATNAAREADRKRLDKPADVATESRRKSYVAPEVIDWKQQRSMDVEQSKGILGR